MEVYLNPVKYCKTPTGHPKGHPCCKIADYDDTAFGAGTLTVHPWRAGPDCGKFIYFKKGVPNQDRVFEISIDVRNQDKVFQHLDTGPKNYKV